MGFMESQGAAPARPKKEADRQLENEYFYQGKPNAAYHGFFEGYREVRIPKQNGKGFVIKREYVMPWVRQDVTDAQWIRNKLIHLALFLASAGAYAYASLRPIQANASFVVAIPGIFALVGMLLTAVALVRYLIRSRNMTMWDYRSGSQRMIRLSLPSAVMLLITAVATLVYVFAWHPEEKAQGVFGAAGYVLSGIFLFGMMQYEERIPYTRVEHETKEVTQGIDIL